MKRSEMMSDIEEPVKSKLTQEEEKLIQLGNEKIRLEKEIDILRIRYEDHQRLFSIQERDYQKKIQVDQDLIIKQLAENKMKHERLERTQSEVNQMRATIEKSALEQKDLLLRKEVELDEALNKVKEERAELAKRIKTGGHNG